jgi:hypothetical protein
MNPFQPRLADERLDRTRENLRERRAHVEAPKRRRVEHEECVIDAIGDVAEAVGHGTLLVVVSLALTKLGKHEDPTDHGCMPVCRFRRELDGDVRSVRQPSHAIAFGARVQAAVVRQELGDCSMQHARGRGAEQLGRGGVDCDDTKLRVERDDAVIDGVENGVKLGARQLMHGGRLAGGPNNIRPYLRERVSIMWQRIYDAVLPTMGPPQAPN